MLTLASLISLNSNAIEVNAIYGKWIEDRTDGTGSVRWEFTDTTMSSTLLNKSGKPVVAPNKSEVTYQLPAKDDAEQAIKISFTLNSNKEGLRIKTLGNDKLILTYPNRVPHILRRIN
jgi:hypothetical protein